jgi:hypothetical protein
MGSCKDFLRNKKKYRGRIVKKVISVLVCKCNGGIGHKWGDGTRKFGSGVNGVLRR